LAHLEDLGQSERRPGANQLAHQFLTPGDFVGLPAWMKDPHHSVIVESEDPCFSAVAEDGVSRQPERFGHGDQSRIAGELHAHSLKRETGRGSDDGPSPLAVSALDTGFLIPAWRTTLNKEAA